MGKFNYNKTDFEDIVRTAEAFYPSINEVHCPYLEEKVSFNVAGLKHLKFKSDKVARSHSEQYARLKLLPLAPRVISLSRTVQGVWETKCFERIRIHSRTDTVLKSVTYYEFIAILDSVRVKVIVKQIEDGKKFFWSIIPYWRVDTINSRRLLYSGDPESD